MRIPKKLKIGGFEITIRKEKDLILERENFGEWHIKNYEIWLDSEICKQQQEETFLHEIVEAINAIYHTKLEHNQLSLIATVFHQIITDNPKTFLPEVKHGKNKKRSGQNKI